MTSGALFHDHSGILAIEWEKMVNEALIRSALFEDGTESPPNGAKMARCFKLRQRQVHAVRLDFGYCGPQSRISDELSVDVDEFR
jgi:hypothetical protein